MDEESVKQILRKSLAVIRQFDWLINSNVLDFYVDDHWNKLPNVWKTAFESIKPEDLSEILENGKVSRVWPLSILTLKVLIDDLCVRRAPNPNIVDTTYPPIYLNHPKIENLFTKGVKSKKRHEIENMAKICQESATKTKTKYIVDFGSGLGHLARKLAYIYNMTVCCVEMQADLNKQAEILDERIDLIAKKCTFQKFANSSCRPIHLTLTLTKSMSARDFIKHIRTALQHEDDTDFSFGMVGLHPCGDLATILIKLFLSCNEAKFINLVGCCYMKLTTSENFSENCGYPLSTYLLKQNLTNSKLSYESREIACHSNEMYTDRLKSGNYNYLKVHSYRAALEKIIVSHSPDKKRLGLRSVKYTENLNFPQYCVKAVQNLGITVFSDDMQLIQIENDLQNWKYVVIFYTLRLLLAPLIESVLLYDRIMFLMENDCAATVNAIFDPKLSPRNHVTTSMKTSRK